MKLNFAYRLNPYRAVNALHLGSKNNSVNAVLEIITVCSTKHINTSYGQNA